MKQTIRLSSVLLLALVTPFIMRFPLSVEDTSYILFGLIFFCMMLFVVADLVFSGTTQEKVKSALLWITIVLIIGSSFSAAILRRHRIAPVFEVHDIILQQEPAIRFLLDGINPYKATYFGTQLENWHYSDTEVNPALYHFVMQPFYLVFSIPFYAVSVLTIGYFDGRLPLYFLYIVSLLIAQNLVKDYEHKFQFVILLAFNPAMLPYTLEGRSDMFMFAFLFGALFALERKRNMIAGVVLALAFSVKQSVWPILPLYVAYLYFAYQTDNKTLVDKKRILQTVKNLVPFIVTLLIIIGPFLLWDAQAYIASTISYLSGSVPYSYPVSGYGFGMVLAQLGVIRNLHAYYPFILWQALFGIPVLLWSIYLLYKTPTVKLLITVYLLFLFIFWYFSRYFNNSHLAFLAIIATAAYFWPQRDRKHVS